MKKTKRIIAICLSVIIALGAIYIPLYTIAQSNENLLKNASITANPEYYNGWYEYNRPISSLTDGQTYVGIGYSAGNMLATPYAVDGTAFVNFRIDSPIILNKLTLYLVGSSAAEANAITDYAVDVKLSDESWKRVAEKHTDSYTEWDAKVEILCFEAVETTEITITIKNSKGQSYAAIYEIEGFFDESITPEDYTPFDSSDAVLPMPTPVNVLAGKTANCSSGYNDWYEAERPVSKLTDEKYIGNAAEMWATDYTDGYAYFEFKFDKLIAINKVVTSFPGSAADVVDTDTAVCQIKDYAIDGMLENGGWVRLAERHIDSNNEAIDYYSDTVLFETQKVVRIRFTFANAYGQEWAAVREVEAYNDSTVTPEQYTEIDCKDFTEFAILKPEYKNLLLGTEIKANEAYYNDWYPENRALKNLIDGKTFVGVGYNAGNAAVIPYGVDGGAYVSFKLKEKMPLNKLVIYLPGTSAYEKEGQVSAYAVEVKEGTEWKRVAVRILENSDNWDAYSDTAVFNSIETDEIRILFVNSKEQTEVSIFEVELFADNRLRDDDSVIPELPEPQLPPTEPDVPNEEEQENSTNILKDSIEIKANDAYYNGWYPENRALQNLTDGNTFVGIGYNAGNAAVIPYSNDGEVFVTLKLKEKTALNKFVIYFPGTSAYEKDNQVSAYAVEVKEGNEWKRVAVRILENSDNWDAYSDTAVFNKVETDEIRILFVNSKGQTEVSIFEVEAYYDAEIKDEDRNCPELPAPQLPPTEPDEPNQEEKELTNVLKDATEIKANNGYYNGWYPENRALKNLIDGKTFVGIGYNAGSATALPYEEDGQAFVSFKLKEKTTLNKLVIYFPGTSAYPKEQQTKCYVVEVRNGEEWKRVAVSNIENSDNWDVYSDTAEFNKIECEEVKVIFMQSKGQIEASLFEIEAYLDSTLEDTDKPLEELPQKPENILKNATDIKANDAYYNGWYPIYRPLAKSIDGNTTFKFDASKATMIPYGSNKHAYIQYDFDKVVKANKFIFYSPDAGEENTMTLKNRLTDYAVDIKLKDGTWKRIIEQHIDRVDDWDIYYEEYLFETVEFVSLRFISKTTENQAFLAISELEAIYDQQAENTNEYMERFVAGASVYKTDKINIPMFGTKREIEMPIKSLLAGIVPTVGLGDNSWYSVERPLVNITDGIQDVFTPANIATVDYHDSIAYYNFEFGGAVKLNTFRFFVPQNSVNDVSQRPVDFAVDVMLKDGTWKRVAEQHIERKQQEDAYCETITFKAVECLAIRLTSVANETMTYFGLSEVEAFYNEYVTDNYTGVTNAPNDNRQVPLPKIRNVPTAKFY